MELGDRKLKILQAIIRDFIITAEPVGSRTLAKKYDLGISSATIRNEMSDLEELGYIEQPHTSAGRIPSDKGYRLYVDNLMIMNKLAKIQKDAIRNSFLQSVGELEQAIIHTSKILSQMTKLTSVALSPQFKRSRLKHLQLIPIDGSRVLLVIVSESGIVKNAVLSANIQHGPEHFEIISNMLNKRFQGLTIGDISWSAVDEMKREMMMYSSIIETVVPVLIAKLEEMVNVHLYLEGITNIFNLPEYNNIDKARDFMSMLDHKEYMKSLLINRKDGVDITIGRENEHEEMKGCSLITATYKYNGIVVGKMGVIGPTRMDYDNTVPTVDFLTKILSELLDDFRGE